MGEHEHVTLDLDSGDTVTLYVKDDGALGLRFDGPNFDGDNADARIVAHVLYHSTALLEEVAAQMGFQGVRFNLSEFSHIPNDTPLFPGPREGSGADNESEAQ